MGSESFAYRLGVALSTPSRIALFGFLLARPGVPFVPQDNTAALVLTLAAAFFVSLPLQLWKQDAAFYAGLVGALLLAIVLRMDAPTTSIVLIGTVIQVLARTSDSYPFVYGFVTVVGIFGVLIQVFDWKPFNPKQLILSGRPWSPDRAGHELLLMCGMVGVIAIINVTRNEIDRLKLRAEEAEAQREAAVVDERARIARELHDVVSHHVTAMTLQAEAASMTGDKAALSSVATAGREALTELRRMLGVLRRPDGEAGDELDPQPGLGQLDALAQRTSSGPQVRIERRGKVRPLSAGLELGVYRLVQEALTNSAKHSDATTVDVVLDYGETDLTVDVIDNGRALAAARLGSGGLGLVGMQERIALLNGELSTGSRHDASGYRVHARLPIDA